jgi:hypothetical protein
LRIADCGLRIAECEIACADRGSPIADCDCRLPIAIADCGNCGIADCRVAGLPITDCRLRCGLTIAD